VNSFHGDNCRLKELYDKNGEEYFHKFKYMILQIFPIRTTDREIIAKEAQYKKRFLTKEFGLNAN
jgi:hypothetical protein